MESEPAETVELDLRNRTAKITSQHLCAVIGVATLLFTALSAYAMYMHQQDQKDASAAFIAAMREQTAVQKVSAELQREQNCIMRIDPKVRAAEPDLCRSVTR